MENKLEETYWKIVSIWMGGGVYTLLSNSNLLTIEQTVREKINIQYTLRTTRGNNNLNSIYLGGLKHCKSNMFNHRVTQRKMLRDTQSVNNQIFTSVCLREKTLCSLW